MWKKVSFAFSSINEIVGMFLPYCSLIVGQSIKCRSANGYRWLRFMVTH